MGICGRVSGTLNGKKVEKELKESGPTEFLFFAGGHEATGKQTDARQLASLSKTGPCNGRFSVIPLLAQLSISPPLFWAKLLQSLSPWVDSKFNTQRTSFGSVSLFHISK